MIKRDKYLEKLKSFKDKKLIKVVTGIRRCGKSTLLKIFHDYLLGNDVEELKPLNSIKDHNPKYLLTLDVEPPTSHRGIKQIYVLDWLYK